MVWILLGVAFVGYVIILAYIRRLQRTVDALGSTLSTQIDDVARAAATYAINKNVNTHPADLVNNPRSTRYRKREDINHGR